MENNNGNKGTLGKVSLALFGVGVLFLLFTVVLTYIPRDNDFRSLLSWLGLLVGFSFIFFGIPMMIASLVTSIVSVIKDRSKKFAYITLSGNLAITVGVICWLFR